MSRTTTIEYDDRSFWVFDEARAIWLKYLIDAVGLRISSGSATHFAASLDSWRVSATVGDFAMTLGPWTPDERDEFLQINSEACSALAASQPLAPERPEHPRRRGSRGDMSRGSQTWSSSTSM
jgi:hypothetical protein